MLRVYIASMGGRLESGPGECDRRQRIWTSVGGNILHIRDEPPVLSTRVEVHTLCQPSWSQQYIQLQYLHGLIQISQIMHAQLSLQASSLYSAASTPFEQQDSPMAQHQLTPHVSSSDHGHQNRPHFRSRWLSHHHHTNYTSQLSIHLPSQTTTLLLYRLVRKLRPASQVHRYLQTHSPILST